MEWEGGKRGEKGEERGRKEERGGKGRRNGGEYMIITPERVCDEVFREVWDEVFRDKPSVHSNN